VHNQHNTKQSAQLYQFLTGLLIFACGFLSFLFHTHTSKKVIRIAASLFSGDGQISDANLSLLRETTLAISIFLTLIGVLLFFLGWHPFKEFFKNIWKVIHTDRILTSNRYNNIPLILTWGATIISLLVVGIKAFEGRFGLQHLYGEDRFMENATFILIFCSAALLTGAAVRSPKGRLRGFFAIAAVLVFIIAFEEISYGQRIFGWETPDLFMKKNIQYETNLHNLLNYQFEALYTLMSLLILPLAFSIYIHLRPQKYTLLEMILPHPGLFCPCFVITFFALVSGFDQQELIEELFSVFFIFYAVRAWFIAKPLSNHKAASILNHKN